MINVSKILVLCLSLSLVCSQTCKTLVPEFKVYPVALETYSLDITQFFSGVSLSFTSNAAAGTFKVVNYKNPVDAGNALPAGNTFVASTILTAQNTEEWAGQVALLAKTATQWIVYPSTLVSSASPTFTNGISLLQGQTPVTCLSITYISPTVLLADCYTVDGQGNLDNEWQLVNPQQPTQFPVVLPSTPSTVLKQATVGFGRVVQYWQSNTSKKDYLFQATLNGNNGVSFLDVFLLDDGVPAEKPFATLSGATLQITDFEVAPNGQILVLDIVGTLTSYTLNEADKKFVVGTVTTLKAGFRYVSLDIGIDFRFPTSGTYTVLIATNAVTSNIQEYIFFGTHDPIATGFYTVPPAITYTGTPVQLDLNSKYVVVTVAGDAYFFARGVADLVVGEYQEFYVNTPLFTTPALWADLNKVPEASLVISATTAQVSIIGTPTIIAKLDGSTVSGSFTLTATSPGTVPATCTSTINYLAVESTDTKLYATTTTTDIQLPKSALYPVNVTIAVTDYVSGPALSVSGTVDLAPAADPQTSKIVQTTLTQVTLNVKDYPTKGGFVFAKNFFDTATNTHLQFLQTSDLSLTAYVCQKSPFQVNERCGSLGTNKLAVVVPKITVLYATKLVPTAYVVIADSATANQVGVYELTWSSADNTGTFKKLYDIKFTYGQQAIAVTDYSVVGDRLFVVLGDISQVWVYSLSDTVEKQLYAITQQQLTTVNAFFPAGVIGDFSTFGPIIFINNQIEVLVVQTTEDIPVLLSTISLLGYAGVKTQLFLVGQDLVVVESKATQVPQITQYSLLDLFKPVNVKSLPLYGATLASPLQLASDDFFFYALTNTNSIYIYKPSAPAHQALYQQVPAPSGYTGTVLFTGASTDTYSNVFVSYSNANSNWQLSKVPTVVFVPGAYNNAYITQAQYSLAVTNSFQGTVPLSFTQKIQVFNTQLQIVVDTNKLASQNTDFTVSKGVQTISLKAKEFVTGSVADYTIECLLCSKGSVTLQNYLYSQSTNINKLTGVQSFANVEGKQLTLVQTITGIYSVTSKNVVTQVYSFTAPAVSCPVLTAQVAENKVVSVCNTATGVITNVLLADKYTTVYTVPIAGLSDPTVAAVVGNNIFLLATDITKSAIPTIQEFTYSATTKQLTLVGTVQCPGQDNYGINGFTIVPVQTNTADGSVLYTIFYTCQNIANGVYYNSFLFTTATTTVGALSAQTKLGLPNTYTLIDGTEYYSIINVPTKTASTLDFILTTSKLMNFVLQYTYTVTSNVVTFAAPTVVTTIPSYGLWAPQNQASYSKGLLTIPYVDTASQRSFVAVYDLTSLDYTKTATTPLQMFGGYYEPLTTSVGAQNLYILEESTETVNNIPTTRILASSTQYAQNLSAIAISGALQLNLNIKEAFDDQDIKVNARNSYVTQAFELTLSYDSGSSKGGLKWWGWLLISLGIVLLLVGVGITVVKCRGKKTGDALLG